MVEKLLLTKTILTHLNARCVLFMIYCSDAERFYLACIIWLFLAEFLSLVKMIPQCFTNNGETNPWLIYFHSVFIQICFYCIARVILMLKNKAGILELVLNGGSKSDGTFLCPFHQFWQNQQHHWLTYSCVLIDHDLNQKIQVPLIYSPVIL